MGGFANSGFFRNFGYYKNHIDYSYLYSAILLKEVV